MFLETLAEVSYNIILPIFLIAGAALVTDLIFDTDPQSLSRLVIYLFTPFLVFQRLATTNLGADEAGKLAFVAIGMCLSMAVLASIVAYLLKYEQRLASAFVLTVTLINAGNYGLPLNLFAFGKPGEERALIFFVSTVTVTYTLGVFLASRGRASAREAFVNIFRVPLPYAVALGLLVNVANIELPTPAARASEVLAQAAVPGMLAVLGLQLRRAKLKGHLRPIFTAAGMRLLVGPLVALPLIMLVGLEGMTRQVAIVQSAMPTAVISSVLAAEFGADAEFVTATILVGTLLSMATLSVLLTIIM